VHLLHYHVKREGDFEFDPKCQRMYIHRSYFHFEGLKYVQRSHSLIFSKMAHTYTYNLIILLLCKKRRLLEQFCFLNNKNKNSCLYGLEIEWLVRTTTPLTNGAMLATLIQS
jgi:hypothetical protein